MADLISYAIDEVRTWDSDEPRDLLISAASLLREVLTGGGGYPDVPQWSLLLGSLEIRRIADVVDVDWHLTQWDTLSDQLVVPLREDNVAKQKIGITAFVTRSVSARIHRDRFPDRANQTFVKWKEGLCYSLDKFVGIYRAPPL